MNTPNYTKIMRYRLSKIEGSFTLDDFRDIPDAANKLSYFCRKNEIKHIGWKQLTATGIPVKIYEVAKLYAQKEKIVKISNRQREYSRLKKSVACWIPVYPEFFNVPEFEVIGTAKHRMCLV